MMAVGTAALSARLRVMGAMTTRLASCSSPKRPDCINACMTGSSAYANLGRRRIRSHAPQELLGGGRLGHLGQLVTLRRVGPERLPGWEQRLEGAVVGLAARPAHLHVADRRLVQVGGVPVARQAPAEVPLAIDALVVVPVEHLHDHLLGAALVLVLR